MPGDEDLGHRAPRVVADDRHVLQLEGIEEGSDNRGDAVGGEVGIRLHRDLLGADRPVGCQAPKAARESVDDAVPEPAVDQVKNHMRRAKAPRDTRVMLLAAQLNLQLKEYGEAEQLLRRIIAIDSTITPAYALLGNAFFAQGRVDEALAEFQGIVKRDPKSVGALTVVGMLQQRQRRRPEAKAAYEQALAGIAAGARHATHLFNRMSPLSHRAPGLTGAVLAEDAVAAEIICDGYHVHPAVATAAIRAKRVERIMAITDGSAGAGLPPGRKVSLGGRVVTVTEDACFLDDGTLCGSRITMDAAFRRLLRQGFTPVEASRMCSGTQAAELGLAGQGVIAPGALADLVVLDRQLEVTTTYVGGIPAWALAGAAA